MRRLVFFLLCFASLSGANSAQDTGACGQFIKKLPNVSPTLCAQAGLQPSSGRSVKGRVLWLRDVGPPTARLRVLVVGAMHGDEFSSASVALHWLAKAQADDMGARWRFIPVLNPDGLLRQPAWRMNANGVDLNRNFPTPNWSTEAKTYWEKRTRKDPRRWPGTAPLSEPESRFLQQQLDSFKPHVVVSIHAPYGLLDFDGPLMPPTKLGRLYLDQVGVFPGSLGNYSGIQRGVPVVTVELPSALRTPTDAEMQKMWLDLRAWMVRTLDAAKPAAVPPMP
jgi:hypothetical protein